MAKPEIFFDETVSSKRLYLVFLKSVGDISSESKVSIPLRIRFALIGLM